MAANYAMRASVIMAVCLFALVDQVDASLQTQLDGRSSLEGVQLAATIASSVPICAGSAKFDQPQSSGSAGVAPLQLRDHSQLREVPGIAEESSSSSAATTSSTDGGSLVPSFLSQATILPGELEMGPVVAMKAMIPPDPPLSGLLKPPRRI